MDKKCKFALMACSLAMVLMAQTSIAQNSGPVCEVETIYSYFEDDGGFTGSDLDMIRPLANSQLQELIDEEMACWNQDEVMCKYSFSVIVEGQDYELTDLMVAETMNSPGKIEVTASFKNFDHPSEVVYVFLKKKDKWLLSDIQSRGESPWSLLEILTD